MGNAAAAISVFVIFVAIFLIGFGIWYRYEYGPSPGPPVPSPGPPVPSPTDKCKGVSCPSGQKCVNGNCVPVGPPLNPCINEVCPKGFTCQNGKCIPVDPCQNIKCPEGETCIKGQCTTDLCLNVNCPSGKICVQGACVSNQTCIDQGTCKLFSGFIQIPNTINTFVGYDGEKFTNKKSIWNFNIVQTLPNQVYQINNLFVDTLPLYCSYYTNPVETCQIGDPDSTEEFYLRKNENGTYTFYTVIVFLNQKQTTYINFLPNGSNLIKLENKDSTDNQILLIASDDQCQNITCQSNEFCALNGICQNIDVPQNLLMVCMQDIQDKNITYISAQNQPLGLTNLAKPDTTLSNLYFSIKNEILNNFIFGNILSLSANGKVCTAVPITDTNSVCNLNPIYIKLNPDFTVSFYSIDTMNQSNYISFYSKDFSTQNGKWTTIQKPIIDLTTKVKMFVNSDPPSSPVINCVQPTPPSPPSPPTPPTPSPPSPPTPSPPTPSPPTPSPPSPPPNFVGYLKNKYVSAQKNSDYYIGWTAPACVNAVCPGPTNLTNLNSFGDSITSSALMNIGFDSVLPNGDLVIKDKQLVSNQEVDANNKTEITLFYFSNFRAQSNWTYYLRYQLYLKKNVDDYSSVENAYSYSLYILDSNNTPNYILFDSYTIVENNVSVAETSLVNDDKCRFYLKYQS